MSDQIHERKDVDPDEGEHKYGDVEFADPVNNKYPIDTPQHIHAAWSYIHQERNADKYSASDADKIRSRISAAAKKHGIELG